VRTLEHELEVGLALGELAPQLAERVRAHLEMERMVETMRAKGNLESLASVDVRPEADERELAALVKLLAEEERLHDFSTDSNVRDPARGDGGPPEGVGP